MKRVKKIMAVITILAFVLGSLLPAISFAPNQALAADDQVIGVETASGDEVGGEDDVVVPACDKPTGGIVSDEGGLNGYFKTKEQISANWNGFVSDTDILNYKYSVWEKVSGSDIKIVKWTKTDDPDIKSFVVNAPFLVDLEEGGLYYTKVKAKNSCGWSKAAKSVGLMLDSVAPTIDSFSLLQDKPYGENVTLSWLASDIDGSGIKSYQLYRNGISLSSALDKSVLSYADTIFGDNLTYSYYLIATDEAGNSSLQSTTLFATVDDIAPAAPSISYWIGGKNIVIFFPAVPGASNYEIYRSGTLIYSGPEIKYTDTNTVRGETYSYTVYALDEAVNRSLPSNTLEIYIPKPQVSSISTSQVLGAATGAGEVKAQEEPSQEKVEEGQVEAEETSKPEETAEEAKTNWSLIIAIIIAAAIVVAGVLYWWYAREEEDEDEI